MFPESEFAIVKTRVNEGCELDLHDGFGAPNNFSLLLEFKYSIEKNFYGTYNYGYDSKLDTSNPNGDQV